MTLARTDIANYLNGQFSALAVSVGQSATPLTGYSPDIDNALRKLGKTEAELATATVDDSLRDAAFALGEYYAAKRIWRQLGDRVNHTQGESTMNFTDQRKNAKDMMDDAANLCAALGYIVDGRKSKTAIFQVY